MLFLPLPVQNFTAFTDREQSLAFNEHKLKSTVNLPVYNRLRGFRPSSNQREDR
jgi:hypothetical protein